MPGLGGVTYNDVFRILETEGVPVFVVGGAVRDAVQGVENIKDIDVSFGCASDDFVDIAKRNGWQVREVFCTVVAVLTFCYGRFAGVENTAPRAGATG